MRIMLKRRLGLIVALMVMSSLCASSVFAGEVQDVLKKVDSNLTSVKDQTYDAKIEVLRDGAVTKTLHFTVQLKGLVQKLVRFTAPGDVRDMTVLTAADGLMYIYMPSYKKVRKVAAHVRNQGFMGTDISPEEMGAAALSKGWHAKMLKKDSKMWQLELNPKAGNDSVYSKMIVDVSKEHEGVTQIKSYDSNGKLVKTQVRSKWKTYGVIHIPSVFTYTDHRTGSKTIMTFFNCKVNQGISDRVFSKRSLMR